MNEIVIDFADPGSITIEFLAKVPGPELTLGQSTMVFSHSESFARANALEGYERLILLAMSGVGAVASSSAASGQPPVVGSSDRAAGAGAWPTHAAMRTCAHFS